MKASENAALQIRKILDGKGTAATRRNLVKLRAVDPVLEALVGDHGRPAPGEAEKAMSDLTKVLETLAAEAPDALIEGLTHEKPAFNLVVWALGHSSTRRSQTLLKHFVDHDDPAVSHVAEHHLERHKRRRKRPTRRKKAPAAKKRPARKAKKTRKTRKT